MNLLEDHARTFRRRAAFAMLGCGAVACLVSSWAMITTQSLNHTIRALEKSKAELQQQHKEHPPIPFNKKDTHTMEDVKTHLTHLFSIPLPGISFSTLTLDEEGMHVRGQAKTVASFDTWLTHVATVFIVDQKVSQPASGRGVKFEVKLHEKP